MIHLAELADEPRMIMVLDVLQRAFRQDVSIVLRSFGITCQAKSETEISDGISAAMSNMPGSFKCSVLPCTVAVRI